MEKTIGQAGEINPKAIDLDSVDWNPEEEADFLDSALGNLYLLTATDAAVAAGSMVPLPVLAASMIVPEGMDEPTDEVLEEVSTAMMRLDEQFRMLEPTGLVEYQPVDEALTREAGEAEEALEAEQLGGELDDEDVSRYGMVRLTPLGLHGVRERMREAGLEVPAVGDLAGSGADVLWAALPVYTEDNARSEIETWFAERAGRTEGEGTADAARELLAAARGGDEEGPVRRLACQQALSLAGPEAEPALREVLDDRQLGGLARVWLAERGAADVPQPDEDMVFWLTVDTIAAQLATAGEPEELQELVRGLVDQHTGFFDKAWRVDHPATGEVLEAMGRVHPDKQVAKSARKAAFKARSPGAGTSRAGPARAWAGPGLDRPGSGLCGLSRPDARWCGSVRAVPPRSALHRASALPPVCTGGGRSCVRCPVAGGWLCGRGGPRRGPSLVAYARHVHAACPFSGSAKAKNVPVRTRFEPFGHPSRCSPRQPELHTPHTPHARGPRKCKQEKTGRAA